MHRRVTSAIKLPVGTPFPPRAPRVDARLGRTATPARTSPPAPPPRRRLLPTLGAATTASATRAHLAARGRAAAEATAMEAARAMPHAVSVVGVAFDGANGSPGAPLDPASHLAGTLFYPTPHTPGARAGRAPRWTTWHYTRGYVAFGTRRGNSVGPLGKVTEALAASFFNTLLATVRLPVAGVALPPSPGPHPAVIFSHGLGGTRHAYSALCAGLAGRGFVVLSLEHADATASLARLAGGRGWLPYESWVGDAGSFSRSAHRQVELATAARVLAALGSPAGAAGLPGLRLEDLTGRAGPPPTLLAGAITPGARPAVVGHSYGGAAAVAAAASGDFSAAVAVDPWYGALPADAPPFTAGLAAPLLILGSHQWNTPHPTTGDLSCGKTRQEALLVSAGGSWAPGRGGAGLVHAVVGGTLHADFADVAALVGAAYPVLAARATKKAMALHTKALGVAGSEGGGEGAGGPGTADAAAVVRLTARVTADWLQKFADGGGVVGEMDGSSLMGAAEAEGVQLAGVEVREGGR